VLKLNCRPLPQYNLISKRFENTYIELIDETNSLMYTKFIVKVMLQSTVSRPVCLAVKHPSEAQDQIFVTVTELRVRWCGTPSLTRGWVCRLQLLLVLASAVIFGSDLLSRFETPQTWRARSSYIPQEQGSPVVPQGTGFPFRRLLGLAGLCCRYSNPPPCGVDSDSCSPLHWSFYFVLYSSFR
jgi:hypothetical protein